MNRILAPRPDKGTGSGEHPYKGLGNAKEPYMGSPGGYLVPQLFPIWGIPQRVSNGWGALQHVRVPPRTLPGNPRATHTVLPEAAVGSARGPPRI